MIFMIFYKTIWVVTVAYPLWRAGTLMPAEEMARIFVWAPFLSVIVPWIYVFKNYVMWPKRVGETRSAAM